MMNSPDLECDEDALFCDCSFHVNARRAERSHDAVPPRCSQCGREPPTHSKHCPKIAPLSLQPCGCQFRADGTVETPCAEMVEMLRSSAARVEQLATEYRERNGVRSRFAEAPPRQSVTIHDPLRAAVLDLAIVIEAGGTLVLTGPNSVISPTDRQYGATLEDASGELSANAYGVELGEVLCKLLEEWRRLQQLEQHQAEHDRARS